MIHISFILPQHTPGAVTPRQPQVHGAIACKHTIECTATAPQPRNARSNAQHKTTPSYSCAFECPLQTRPLTPRAPAQPATQKRDAEKRRRKEIFCIRNYYLFSACSAGVPRARLVEVHVRDGLSRGHCPRWSQDHLPQSRPGDGTTHTKGEAQKAKSKGDKHKVEV